MNDCKTEVKTSKNDEIFNIKSFIVVAAFSVLVLVYYLNASNPPADPDIPTDLISGILGMIVAYYFKTEHEVKKN